MLQLLVCFRKNISFRTVIMATPKTWAKIQPLEGSTNLSDITVEQLAESMIEKQERKLNKYLREDRNPIQVDKQKEQACEASDTDNDIVIANLLQDEFNQEYNTVLKRTEEAMNRDSKVGISLVNYRLNTLQNKDEDNLDKDDGNKDFDRFVSIEKEYASIPRCGYKKDDEGSIVTKHDTLISSRMNACRVQEFPCPGISTGDMGGFDSKLDNKVYNVLRVHSHAQKKKGKISSKPKT